MLSKELREAIRIDPGERVNLKKYAKTWKWPKEAKELNSLGTDAIKDAAKKILAENLDELAEAQDLLYATGKYSVLIVLQAMDAAGKDGTIKHVMSGVNPQGCQVFSFKKPSDEELKHNFLWRYAKSLPERGRIGIFNRSYYEEVLVLKVHPEILDGSGLPDTRRGKSFWSDRYEDINAFERHLVRNGTVILKFFLHVPKKEQKRRFLERLDNPEKHWKFSPADLKERPFWNDYMGAYEDAIEATSTKWAPWYVVPAMRKYVTRALVADVITSAIKGLDLEIPPPSPEKKKLMAAARRQLNSE